MTDHAGEQPSPPAGYVALTRRQAHAIVALFAVAVLVAVLACGFAVRAVSSSSAASGRSAAAAQKAATAAQKATVAAQKATAAGHTAGQANSAQLALCRSGNQARAAEIGVWEFLIHLSRPPHSARARALLARFEHHLHAVYHKRDCATLGRGAGG